MTIPNNSRRSFSGADEVKLTQVQLFLLDDLHASPRQMLFVGEARTMNRLIERGLAKYTRDGWKITAAGRAVLKAYLAERSK